MFKNLVFLIFLGGFISSLYGDKLEDIQTTGILKAGVKYDYKPFGFIKDDKVVGFDIDLARYIANNLGVALQMQQVTSKNRIQKVKNDTIDIAIASMTHNKKREKDIDFSIHYFFDGQSILAKSDLRKTNAIGFNGKYIAAIKGSTSGINFKKLVPKARIKYYDDYNKALEDLNDGYVDAITTDLIWCITQIKNNPMEYKIVGKKLSSEPYGIGVKKGEDRLLTKINEILLNSVQDGTYERLYQKWFDEKPTRLPSGDLEANKL